MFGTNDYWGGAREGAGRKKIGESRALRITLPKEEWEVIDKIVEQGGASSLSDYFRRLSIHDMDKSLFRN